MCSVSRRQGTIDLQVFVHGFDLIICMVFLQENNITYSNDGTPNVYIILYRLILEDKPREIVKKFRELFIIKLSCL